MTDASTPSKILLRSLDHLRSQGIPFRRLDSIKRRAGNPRDNAEAVPAIVASLQKFGWTQPMLIDPRTELEAGDTRYLAASYLGLVEVPVIETEHDEHMAKLYVPADNRLGEIAKWNGPKLADLLKSYTPEEIRLTGWEPKDIRALLGRTPPPLSDDDEVTPPAEPITKLGDLWQMGEHLLLCGDATNAEHVARVLADRVPLLMVTDPPYGVDYDPSWRVGLPGQWAPPKRLGKVQNDTRVDWRQAWALFPGPIAYVWHAGVFAGTVQASLEVTGFEIRSQIMWTKPYAPMSRGAYHWQHEPCWYAVRKGSSAKWTGDRKQTTCWPALPPGSPYEKHRGDSPEDAVTTHGTQKPIEVMRRPLLNHGDPGDLVYDPFVGSGTTLIAAERTQRVFAGLDLDPAYVDASVARWEKVTGKKAVLVAA